MEERIEELQQLLARLSALEVPAGAIRDRSVCDALMSYIEGVLQCTVPEFKEQRATLGRLVELSPLLAPVLSQPLSAKLSAAFATPGSCTSTTSSPRLSPRSSRLLSGSSSASSPCESWQLPEASVVHPIALDGIEVA